VFPSTDAEQIRFLPLPLQKDSWLGAGVARSLGGLYRRSKGLGDLLYSPYRGPSRSCYPAPRSCPHSSVEWGR